MAYIFTSDFKKYFSAFFIIILVNFYLSGFSQNPKDSTNTVSLLFIGDIMGHDPQISSAYNDSTKRHEYDDCFKFIMPEINEVDFAIANLEVTLAGKPYRGYPQFSSPDELAVACKNAGIDILVTANNHSCDRGKDGIIRTLKVLDSLKIQHTGTFNDSLERLTKQPLIIKKNNIRIALLNYTYGTNGLPIPYPTIVNIINKKQIEKDLAITKLSKPDKIIIFIHWGTEYQSNPNTEQISLTDFFFEKGADIIIGSHPHVIQKMVWLKDNLTGNDKIIAYSLGNFISNQRQQKTDGGAILKLIISKSKEKTIVSEAGYYLVWVYTPLVAGKKKFFVLPCSKYEQYPESVFTDDGFMKMKLFIDDSRELFLNQNIGIREYKFINGNWKL